MDQTKKLNQQSLSQIMNSQFQRKLTQLLLSVSVFSLFLCYSYCLSLLHSFNFNFHNSLPFQFLGHTIDKKCIFLVCNGLLVFLVKNSGLISSTTSMYNDDDQSFKSYEDHVTHFDNQSIDLEPEAPLLDNEAAVMDSTVEAIKNSTVIVEEEDKVLVVSDIGGSEICDREEQELIEGNRVLSTEELNKRFDEFIAKMREELRFEARQRLIMT